jgi:uncharacterized membrane protein
MKCTARALVFVASAASFAGCASHGSDVDSESHFQCGEDNDCANAPGRSVCRHGECVLPGEGPIVLDESPGPVVDCTTEWPPEAVSFETTGNALDVDGPPTQFSDTPKLNRNGTVVVGHAYHFAGGSYAEAVPGHLIRWAGDTVSRFAQMTAPMVPVSVSCDGLTVVGGTPSDPTGEPYRWSASDGFALLPAPDGMSPGGLHFATAVSQDGSTAWGVYQSEEGTTTQGVSGSQYRTHAVAVRWEGSGPAEELFALPEATDWSPGWTSDGSAFSGHTGLDFFVQSQEGAPTFLGTPSTLRMAQATAMSVDGQVFAGQRFAAVDDGPPKIRAYVWSAQNQLEDVRDYAVIVAVTPGGVAVGSIGARSIGSEDYVWDRRHGVRRLHEVLSAHGLILPSTTVITGSTDISADGRVITGFCTEGGKERLFRAVLPAGAFD